MSTLAPAKLAPRHEVCPSSRFAVCWAMKKRDAHLMSPHLRQNQQAAAEAFYRRAISLLLDAGVPFMIGGGYAVRVYTGVTRKTKDVDLFLLPDDIQRALACLASAGFQTELPFSHWLAKARTGENFIDLIFNSGNGCCPVDQAWFDHATDCKWMGLSLKLCPPEESIWQKAFIMERERYDGADVAHLIKACAPTLDWRRLLWRFGESWQVLFSHLILFSFIYPDHLAAIPKWLMVELSARLEKKVRLPKSSEGVCRGTLLSREQYLSDINDSGYQDPRLPPNGAITADQVAQWTPPTTPEGR